MQAGFAARLLEACHEHSIHTALETCGYAPWTAYQAILPHLDQLIFDIKHLDADSHTRLTGVSNALVLDNARRLAGSGVSMTIRMPVIPGRNDSEENVLRLAEFVAGLAGPPPVELLPYHGYGKPKYERLGRDYTLSDLEPPKREGMLRLRDLVRSHGVRCEVA